MLDRFDFARNYNVVTLFLEAPSLSPSPPPPPPPPPLSLRPVRFV